MIGMRNRMIHQYDKVNLAIVWDTVQNALPRILGLKPRTSGRLLKSML